MRTSDCKCCVQNKCSLNLNTTGCFFFAKDKIKYENAHSQRFYKHKQKDAAAAQRRSAASAAKKKKKCSS